MFELHIIDDIPKDIDEIKKLDLGVYKVRGKSCLIIADLHGTRAVFDAHCYWYRDYQGWYNIDSIYYSNIRLNKQDYLNTLLELDLKEDKRETDFDLGIRSYIYSIKSKMRKNTKTPKIGVELELETDNEKDYVNEHDLYEFKNLVQLIKNDSSVYNGLEINFTYGGVKTWKIKEVSKLLKECKKQHLDNRYGTAGMHVHVSGKGVLKVLRRIYDNFDKVYDIVMPVSSRRKYREKDCGFTKRWGTGADFVRDQTTDFGTVEFRCFEATTDAKIFKRRLEFCRTLFNFLKTDKPIEDFFNSITQKEKDNYKALLLDSNNECAFGPNRDEMLLKLN